MKTHPDSVWIDCDDITRATSENHHGYVLDATVTGHEDKVSCDESKDIQVSAESLVLTRKNSTYPFSGQFLPYVTGAPSDLSGWVRFVRYDQYVALEKERDELRSTLSRGIYISPNGPYDNECPEGVPGFNYRG